MSKLRYIIYFEFRGADFFGSQKQPDKRTVQGEIEKALNVLCRTLIKDKVNIFLSGRTDAKVSSKYQVAHFDLDKKIQNLDNFLYKLNCILPDDVKVFEIVETKNAFHAQKDAKYKHYRYSIQNDHVASVFLKDCLFYPYCRLNIERLNESLSYLVGHHDFSSFKSKSDNPYNDCIVYYAKAIERIEKFERKTQRFIFIDIIGNRFLYNMVRTIVGQLLLIERNDLNPKVMYEILNLKDRTKAANTAPAEALCLEYVGYDNVDDYIQKINS